MKLILYQVSILSDFFLVIFEKLRGKTYTNY